MFFVYLDYSVVILVISQISAIKVPSKNVAISSLIQALL